MVYVFVCLSVFNVRGAKDEQDDSGVADAQYFEEWLLCTSVFPQVLLPLTGCKTHVRRTMRPSRKTLLHVQRREARQM